jgi:fermentation-respiration switch protein FrsA (DUF1100 family)
MRVGARRRIRLGVAAAVSVALLVLAYRSAPTLALSASLALPASETALARLSPEPIRDEIVVMAGDHRVDADLYRPPSVHGGLVLVHGLSRAGRRHPELVRLARLLARHGHLVLVPQLEGLAAFRLDGAEVDDIRAALDYLGGRTPAVGIAGFSFGAGPALLAAAAQPRLALAASFGGYADLRNVITYITTGIHTFRGQQYVQHQQEYNRWKLLALLVGFVDSARDRDTLSSIATRKLGDPAADTTGLESELGAEGHAVLRLVLNRQPAAVPALLAELSHAARDALASLSPLAAVSRLRSPVLIAHGVGDDSIPFTESLRLADAAGDRGQLALLRTFHHTGAYGSWGSWSARVIDAWSVMRLADALLRFDRR